MSAFSFVIRQAEPADVGRLTELLRTLFAIETDFSFDPRRQQRALRLMLASDQCRILVADTAEGVVAMATGQRTFSTAEGGPSVLVEDVVVTESWRNRGIGRRLLTELHDWARQLGATRLQLLADRQNTPALRFYRDQGWQETRMIGLTRYLRDHEQPAD